MNGTLKVVALCAALVGACASGSERTTELQPLGVDTAAPAALVLVGARYTAPRSYEPLARAIEEASGNRVSVGIVEPAFGAPSAVSLIGEVEAALDELRMAGMCAQRVLIAAHGTSGPAVLDYVASSRPAVDGVILMGAFIPRNRRERLPDVPIFTLGGELDGVCRVTRLAEAYHHQIGAVEDVAEATATRPVVVLPGVSHLQFSAEQGSLAAKEMDLEAEVSTCEARRLIAEAVSDFVLMERDGNGSRFGRMAERVAATGQRVAPLIDSMRLEGSYHLKPPCSAPDAEPTSCWSGSAWTERAQVLMAGLPEATLEVEDVFYPVAQVDSVHFPTVDGACEGGESECTLNLGTISEAVYEPGGEADDGTTYVSANEIRAKLMSRQSVHIAAGDANADFAVTDAHDLHLCGQINAMAWQWALDHASDTARDRFEQNGIPYAMGDDVGPLNMGPLWIWSPLQYSDATDGGGAPVRMVQSPTMSTPADYLISSVAGFHYCKLLSPARAMEWIYVDGLRAGLKRGG